MRYDSGNSNAEVIMALFILGLTILTASQFLHVFVIAALAGVFVAISMAVARLVFHLTGAPQ
jgi:hypothetical protein